MTDLTREHLETFVFDPHRAAEFEVKAMAGELIAARARIAELERTVEGQVAEIADKGEAITRMRERLRGKDDRVAELEAECGQIWNDGVAGRRLLEERGDRLAAELEAKRDQLGRLLAAESARVAELEAEAADHIAANRNLDRERTILRGKVAELEPNVITVARVADELGCTREQLDLWFARGVVAERDNLRDVLGSCGAERDTIAIELLAAHRRIAELEAQ